ncbi:glycine cleavage system aminomethyltransferase GcvT [Kocuria flava]|uniref:glycine cleavage system aminomethyltransferase GcvT n=1 Tax=Kocuria flava TaxID=446860 RepID=UPI001FF4DE34|nr:glycine cleavage system aminomethyltransferase GcvT [Kocuria flava]MCJ8505028.1 glycine cleavage system aminomethyltransferase GcvT [Kocuria flava]
MSARTTPLEAAHREAGAVFTDFGGWQMPLKYANDVAEHHAVRRAAGLFDLSHMGEIAVEGPQAAQFLDAALVSRMSALAPGRAKYTLLVDEDGRVLDDLITYRLAEDRFLVVPNAANTATALRELRARAEGFDVVVKDRTEATALVAVQGPAAEDVLLAAGCADPDAVRALRYYACVPTEVAGVPALVARTGYTGEDGFELYTAPEHARTVWDALLAAGEDRGVVPAGLAARDSLRLEAGMPLYGHELGTGTTAAEAGLGRLVEAALRTKEGPFTGRAALEAQAASAPARVLVGLRGLGRRPVRAGNAVVSGDEQVGEVTSGVPSPTLGHPVAMALVRPEASAPGTALEADVRGRRAPVEVVELPFYRRG